MCDTCPWPVPCLSSRRRVSIRLVIFSVWAFAVRCRQDFTREPANRLRPRSRRANAAERPRCAAGGPSNLRKFVMISGTSAAAMIASSACRLCSPRRPDQACMPFEDVDQRAGTDVLDRSRSNAAAFGRHPYRPAKVAASTADVLRQQWEDRRPPSARGASSVCDGLSVVIVPV